MKVIRLPLPWVCDWFARERPREDPDGWVMYYSPDTPNTLYASYVGVERDLIAFNQLPPLIPVEEESLG